MTDAANGLRLSASAPALAIADMKIDDILAGMADDQRPALLAALGGVPAPAPAAAAAATPADDDDAGMIDEEKAEKKKKMADKDKMADGEAAAEARGFAAGTARAVAVMSSEHFEGRASHAIRLLGNAKHSAEEITGTLADLPDGTGASMLDAIRGKNPDLGTGGEASGDGAPATAANHGWGAIQAKVAKQYGRAK